MSVKITVVTPSYNQAQYLEETLRSVLSQRDQIHEYFVLDGGSTDGSADIIRKYADQGIDWWVSEKDKGQSDAIIRGFSKATGDVLCWLNSDDVFLPGALARVRQAFDEHPDAGVVSGYLVLMDGESRIMRMPRVRSGVRSLLALGYLHVLQQSTFFKRSLYESVGGIDINLHCCMDTDLWSRFAISGAEWQSIPVYLAGFRKHEETKGVNARWMEKYRREGELVHARYPQLFTTRHGTFPGRRKYQLMQIASGRHLRDIWDSWRYKGRKITDLFGDWKLEPFPCESPS